MKLWRAVSLATVIDAKDGGERSISCHSEETQVWKNEMIKWKRDQDSEFSGFFSLA